MRARGCCVALLMLAASCAHGPATKVTTHADAATVRVCNEGAPATSPCLPPDQLAHLLATAPLEIASAEAIHHGLSHAQRLTVRLPDGARVRVKWKTAGWGGDGSNRSPRHELAAFAVQRLLLAPDEEVVPPTALRCLSRDETRRLFGRRSLATFRGTDCVLGTVSHWLEHAAPLERFDRDRFARDPAYRDALARLNLVTYVIDHRDAKNANFLVENQPLRVFAVDNGLAFSGFRTWRGYLVKDWSRLLVTALPCDAVERLWQLRRRDLDALLVLAEFRVRGREVVPVPPGRPLDDENGVRRQGDVIQLGLTADELDDLWRRILEIRELVAQGQVKLFRPARAACTSVHL